MNAWLFHISMFSEANSEAPWKLTSSLMCEDQRLDWVAFESVIYHWMHSEQQLLLNADGDRFDCNHWAARCMGNEERMRQPAILRCKASPHG